MIMALNREQKSEVAALLIQAAGNLVEFWGEREEELEADHPLKGVTQADIRAQLSMWLYKMPGSAWDLRLDEVH